MRISIAAILVWVVTNEPLYATAVFLVLSKFQDLLETIAKNKK